MSPRQTRAATVKQSVSTRSKTQKVNNVSQDVVTSAKKVRQRKEKSANVKKNLEAAAKQSAKKESPDAKVTVKKSTKKKTARRKLNLNKEAETEDIDQNVNKSIRILKDRYCNNDTTLELVKHSLLQSSNATKDLEKLPNGKLQQKTSAKISPVIVTPKSTPPKLSLTPHRSNKTPKKSPISLGSPKTHSIALPKLFKSPRKLSLAATNEDSKKSLEKSDSNSHAKKSRKNKKNNLSNSPISDKDELTKKNKHKKSDINLKVIVNINCERKFSKSPKIVLKSPKSKKSKSRKLKLSPSRKKDVIKTSPTTSPGTTSNLNNVNSPRIRIKKSPLSKGKNLLIKRRLLNSKLIKTLTTSQIKDVLTEPVVLLEKLSPESMKRKNILTIASKTRSDTLMKVRSPSIRTGSNSKIIPIKKASTDMSVKRNSSPKLRKSSMEKSQINNTNRISPRIKYNMSIQGRDILSVPLMSSTPQNEKTALTNTSLRSNTSIASVNNTSLNTKFKHRNQSNMSNIMNENSDIKNISEPSLFDKEINNTSQSFLLNVTKRDTTYNKNNTMEKKQEDKKDNTYELEQPQTISLRQMIKKRTSTDANISLRDSVKKAKVRFADVTFDKNSERKSINKSNRLRSNISHVNAQNRSNITNSTHKSKNETAKLAQNSLISPFKRSSPRLGYVPRIQLNKIQVTPKTFTSIEKKSEKKSSTKKVPNFGKIHERMFNKSESLVDAKKRLEARHLAFIANKSVSKDVKTEEKKPLPTDSKDGIHNRFGFKLKKSEATNIILKKQTDLSRQKHQHESRMMLKGIRTNRRFELQMKARNLNL